LESIGEYAGKLGDCCYGMEIPCLNALIINTTGKPGEEFFEWAECDVGGWGEEVAKCLGYFHLPFGKKIRYKHTTGISRSVDVFFENEE
jgi:hypothetical protein